MMFIHQNFSSIFGMNPKNSKNRVEARQPEIATWLLFFGVGTSKKIFPFFGFSQNSKDPPNARSRERRRKNRSVDP